MRFLLAATFRLVAMGVMGLSLIMLALAFFGESWLAAGISAVFFIGATALALWTNSLAQPTQRHRWD